jgi:radical SAM protein with 4Fe4S-binding SPASM domain
MNKALHILKLAWGYRFARAGRQSYPPYQYTIEPTNICNLRCSFCPQSDPDHAARRPQGYLTADLLKEILAQIVAAGTGNTNLNFTLDGEPLLNPDFCHFVATAAEHGFFSVFATNGTMLTPIVADQLIAAGPFRVSMDFAADRSVYESIRGRPGDFDTVLENLRYLVTQSQQEHRVHIDLHDIAPFTGANPARSLNELRALFPADLPSRVRFHTRQFHNFCGHLEMARQRTRYRLCPYPWTQMAITHSGDIVPCCRDTVGRSILGNVLKEGVLGSWNGERYRRFRQNLIDQRPDRNAACALCDLPWSADSPRWQLKYMIRSLYER